MAFTNYLLNKPPLESLYFYIESLHIDSTRKEAIKEKAYQKDKFVKLYFYGDNEPVFAYYQSKVFSNSPVDVERLEKNNVFTSLENLKQYGHLFNKTNARNFYFTSDRTKIEGKEYF